MAPSGAIFLTLKRKSAPKLLRKAIAQDVFPEQGLHIRINGAFNDQLVLLIISGKNVGSPTNREQVPVY